MKGDIVGIGLIALTDDDAYALAAYLKSLKPIRNPIPQPVGATEKPPSPYLKVIKPE